MSFFNFLNMPKAFVVAIYEKVAEKANKTGTTVKVYLHEEKNIEHISLVIYDLLPLTVKFGLRHEKFHEKFAQVFKKIRSELFIYEEEQEKKAKTEVKLVVKEVKPTVKKPRAKKTVDTTEVIKKSPVKKVPKKPATEKSVASKKVKVVKE